MTARSVLVVDDDDEIRDALSDVLEDEGYDVVSARDGRQALDCLRKGPRPCAILFDLWMPVMDGWQFRRELLADGRLRDIPVIVLTAAPGQKAHELGAVDVIRKPISLERLLGALAGQCVGAS